MLIDPKAVMPASPSSLIASLSAVPAELGPPQLTIGLPAALAAVPDPRARRGIRHRLVVVLTAAVCAVVAGCRSYTAIAEWVADLPADTAALLGIDPDRRPSEAMIRRLLQAPDPDRLAAAIGTWLAAQIPAPAPGFRQAIAVDGKTLRGSPPPRPQPQPTHGPTRHHLTTLPGPGAVYVTNPGWTTRADVAQPHYTRGRVRSIRLT